MSGTEMMDELDTLGLDDAASDGRIGEGDLVLIEAMGGGLTWGAALARG